MSSCPAKLGLGKTPEISVGKTGDPTILAGSMQDPEPKGRMRSVFVGFHKQHRLGSLGIHWNELRPVSVLRWMSFRRIQQELASVEEVRTPVARRSGSFFFSEGLKVMCFCLSKNGGFRRSAILVAKWWDELLGSKPVEAPDPQPSHG